MKILELVGSGDKIGKVVAPVIIIGLLSNILYPSFFSVGGPSDALKMISMLILIPGITNWLWSVALILRLVPQNKLITVGPYAIVKHPLYAGVALLVLPWVGFLFNSWLGLLIGIVLYIASRYYYKDEEQPLREKFGEEWVSYEKKVLLPWL